MIRGYVTSQLDAIIPLNVETTSGEKFEIEASIDTGFTGYLTLPKATLSRIGSESLYRSDAQLADGSTHSFDMHLVVVHWFGEMLQIEVEAAETAPLLGMGLLAGHRLTIEAVEGGLLEIVKLSR